MFPTIPIGPLRIQTQGLLLIVGYMAGLWLAARRGKRHGIDGDHLYNAGFYALLGGLVVARLAHAVAYFEVYRIDPMQVLSLSPGAFLALPGLVGAVVIVAIYVRRHRLPPDGFADALAPGILLTLAIASLGSFLSGSVLGAVSQAPWGVEMFGVTRQPAALLEALVLLALLGALLAADNRGKLRPGQTALLALFGYAAVRLFLEPLRADSALVGDGLRLTQLVALAVVAVVGWLLARSASPPAPATATDQPESPPAV